MSQSDFLIANQSFPQTRAAINAAFAALVQQSSGLTEPPSPYKHQFWMDEATNTLKIRNLENSAWIVVGEIDVASGLFVVDHSTAMPTGTPMLWLTDTPPNDDWYLGHGFTHSRDTDSDLWEFAQSSGLLAASEAVKEKGQFGPGDGLTTFTGPDYRGAFLRIVDSGAGIDPARLIGSFQTDLIAAHTHLFGANFIGAGIGSNGGYVLQGASNVATSSVGGAETRPKNIALNIMYRR